MARMPGNLTPTASAAWMAALLLAGAALPAAGAGGDRVTLRAAVACAPGPVTLADIAELTGPGAEALGSLVVVRMGENAREVSLRRAEVEALLTAQDVNWGRLSLRGFGTCRLTPRPAAEMSPATQPTPAGLGLDASRPLSNPIEPLEVPEGQTLRDRVRDMLVALAGAPAEELKVDFSAADSRALDLPLDADRWELEPAGTQTPGRVPVIARRYRGDRPVETLRVTADVSRRFTAVVAVRDIARGQVLAPSDLEARQVWLDKPGQPRASLEGVVGQTAASVIRAGTVVTDSHLASPLLVRSGEYVTVRCIRGELVVRTVARARRDGALDQVIPVQNEKTRQTYFVRVTGAREGLVVSEEPREPAAGALAGAAGAGRNSQGEP